MQPDGTAVGMSILAAAIPVPAPGSAQCQKEIPYQVMKAGDPYS